MNTVKGSLYVLFQSYKKQIITFWCILFSIVLFSLFIDTFFELHIYSFSIMISIPVYIFSSVMAAKLLNKTLSYFLRLGLCRLQFMFNVGLFFICWSLVGAFIIGCTQKIITFVSNIFIIHPILLFNNSPSFLQTMAFDTVLLLFFLTAGLLLNVVFYRLGTIGGYSFIGLLALISIVTIIFKWYSSLFDLLSNTSTFTLVSSLLVFSILLYSILTMAIRNASVNPA
ncbi:hypothetical protein FJQ98_06780 [Lysinibacillus agricola]|uniref:ABC transporter permease n=1 Tax=Lysinibacillus agricola TaxID=2590012 RepID=A0ABX7AV76_9BACI|nr:MULTISPECIES: hypothetical protein [Lysinibacillus]KOS62774.1 hypothetical protein AN161_10675 [Lysinibacillus sp. FJAT-14222]QQP13749.1 hypothetical protein FJQ98_06780 [Lysinibacillus agricola]